MFLQLDDYLLVFWCGIVRWIWLGDRLDWTGASLGKTMKFLEKLKNNKETPSVLFRNVSSPPLEEIF
jgi:hypothetical protein